MLLAVVAVASGVTITCSCGGIGLYNPGWDAAFEDAAKDAATEASDAAQAKGDASDAME
jgi:hypothetical protein